MKPPHFHFWGLIQWNLFSNWLTVLIKIDCPKERERERDIYIYIYILKSDLGHYKFNYIILINWYFTNHNKIIQIFIN